MFRSFDVFDGTQCAVAILVDERLGLVLDLPGLLKQVSPAYSAPRSAPPPMPAAQPAAAGADDMDLELF